MKYNMKIITTTATLLTVLLLVGTTTTAYAQLPQEVPSPESVSSFEADPEATAFALGIATSVLWNLTDKAPSVTFTEDGTMSINHAINTERGLVFISVSATHNLTPENGYVYDNDTITAPNGTRIFP
jgi:hypothetical protein